MLLASLPILLIACEGPTGPAGPPGPSGDAGTSGPPGTSGDGGEPGRSPIFAGPGLVLSLSNPVISGTTASVEFTIENDDGVPLDRNGQFTPDSVSISFILARRTELASGDVGPYEALTTRSATGAVSGTVTQSGTDSGGTFVELAPGEYRYTFATPITVADPTITHTVAAYASRETDGVSHVSNATLDFVPDGVTPVATRELVMEEACNTCHGQIAAHGGSRQDLVLCLTCHSPKAAGAVTNNLDPDTGNSFDFRDMLHRIHMGADLPRVAAGEPYEIIGFQGSVHDYTDVIFPHEINDCATCHQGADADEIVNRPSITVCGSCHDAWFGDPAATPAGFVDHTGPPQANDNACSTCHADGSLAPIVELHTVPLTDTATNPPMVVTFLGITNTSAGQQPIVDFRVEIGGVPIDLTQAAPADPVTRLRVTFAGPNTDFQTYWQVDCLNAAQATLTPINAAAGEFSCAVGPAYAMPVGAEGSYSVSFEGRYTGEKYAFSGTPVLAVEPVDIPMETALFAFAVTDDEAVERHMVVDSEKCNGCHLELRAHGGGRTDANYCIYCHQPGNANDERAARYEVAPGELGAYTALIETVDFKQMIHRIHMGDELSQAYVLGGNPAPSAGDPDGNPVDFTHVRYPNDPANCLTCHIDGTFELPLPSGRESSRLEIRECLEDPAADGDNYCTTPNWVVTEPVLLRPERSACTGCHDSDATDAHAQIMTTPAGAESCATCHGPGSEWDVVTVHGLAP